MGVALLVAFALSLDGFGVGMAYGIKNIRIPFWSMCIIGLCTVAAMGVSMIFGYMLIPYLDIISPKILGAVILMAIGVFQCAKTVFSNNINGDDKNKKTDNAVPVIALNSTGTINENQQLFRLDLSIFGLVIQILKTPAVADIDNSGTISIPESILLGLALSVDAISSGLAASIAGIPSYSIVLVALIQYFMIRIGLLLAEKLSPEVLKRAEILPGILLVLVGLLKII